MIVESLKLRGTNVINNECTACAIAIDRAIVLHKDKNSDDIDQMVNDNDLDKCLDEKDSNNKHYDYYDTIVDRNMQPTDDRIGSKYDDCKEKLPKRLS